MLLSAGPHPWAKKPAPGGPGRTAGGGLIKGAGKFLEKNVNFLLFHQNTGLFFPGTFGIMEDKARSSASRSGALPTPRPLSTEKRPPYTTAQAALCNPYYTVLPCELQDDGAERQDRFCVLYLLTARVYGLFSVPRAVFVSCEWKRGGGRGSSLPRSYPGRRPPRRRKTKLDKEDTIKV